MSRILFVEQLHQEDVHEIWPKCTALAQSMSYPSYFCSSEWLSAALENLAPDDKLHFLAVKDQVTVMALLPLVAKSNALGGRDLHILGVDFFPDPLGLICNPINRSACAIAIKNYLHSMSGWDRLVLDYVYEDELVAWELPGKPQSTQFFKRLPDNPDELMGEFNPKKRHNLRTMVRKLMKNGGSFIPSTDKDSQKHFLNNLFSLQQKRTEEKSLACTFEGHRVESLHRFLVDHADHVRFYALNINGQIAAVIYGFEFCNTFFYYRVAHDPAYGHLSPGSVLLFLVIEDCCLRGMKEFNFLQGNESYKLFWAKDSRVLYRAELLNDTFRANTLNALEKGKWLLKKGLTRLASGS